LSVKRHRSLLGVLSVKLQWPMCLVAYVQKSDLHLIKIFCEVIAVKKFIMAASGSLLVFCSAQKEDTFGAYYEGYTFAQPAVQTARWS